MATFITSKEVGQTISIAVITSTGYWKYNHNGTDSSAFVNGEDGVITISNANGEFTLISCDSDGFPSGDITELNLADNQLTSFDGTGLSGLFWLGLEDNQLTSFDGTDLSSLNELSLSNNQLTSINIAGCDILQILRVNDNPLTPVINNSLLAKLAANELANDWDAGEFVTSGERTSSSTTDYDYLIANGWYISGADLTLPVTFTTSKSVGEMIQFGVITSTGYWKYKHNGVNSIVQSNSGAQIPISNANGEFTIIPCLSNGIPSGNIIEIDLSSDPGKNQVNQITSFNGTGLSSLTGLYLGNNQLTSFNGTGLSALTNLSLDGNPLISFYGGDMGQITIIGISSGVLESFDGTGLSLLLELYLQDNQLTSINIDGCDALRILYVSSNPLTPVINNSLLAKLAANELANDWDSGEFSTSGGRTSAGTTDYDYLIANGWNISGADIPPIPTFITSKAVGEMIIIYASSTTGYWKSYHNGTYSSVFSNGGNEIVVENANGEFAIVSCDDQGNITGSIIELSIDNNQITSFDGTGLSSLVLFSSYDNQLSTFDGTGLSALTTLDLTNNQLTSINITDCNLLYSLQITGNPSINTPSVNNSFLSKLAASELVNDWGETGNFQTTGGRTAAGTPDYDYLISEGWYIDGADLVVVGSGKLRVKGVGQINP